MSMLAVVSTNTTALRFFFSFHKKDIIKVDSGDKKNNKLTQSYITEIDVHYIARAHNCD